MTSSTCRGAGLAEIVAVTALVALGLLVAVPTAVGLIEGARISAGAREMVTALRGARWLAVSRGRAHGLFFSQDASGWSWIIVGDGNGNGLRVAEVRAGIDTVVGDRVRLEDRVEGVTLGFPGVGPFPGVPPRRTGLIGDDDPVRFGRSDLIAFAPTGRASTGTLYLTDRRESLAAIVVFGASGRLRVWQFRARSASWKR